MKTLEQTVQELSDRAAIHDLLTRYVVTADRLDWEAVSRCFTEDATANYGGTELGPGRQAIYDYFTSRAPNQPPNGPRHVTMHFLGNVSVDVAGDAATAESYLHVNMVNPERDDEMVMRGLRYLDRLARTRHGWQIRRRVHELQWIMSGPLTFALDRSRRASAVSAP